MNSGWWWSYCLLCPSVTSLSLHLPPSPGNPGALGKWPHSLPCLGGPDESKSNLIPLLVSTNEVCGPTRSEEQFPGSPGLVFDLLWDRINGRKRLYGTSGPRAPGCCAENTTYRSQSNLLDDESPDAAQRCPGQQSAAIWIPSESHVTMNEATLAQPAQLKARSSRMHEPRGSPQRNHQPTHRIASSNNSVFLSN